MSLLSYLEAIEVVPSEKEKAERWQQTRDSRSFISTQDFKNISEKVLAYEQSTRKNLNMVKQAFEALGKKPEIDQYKRFLKKNYFPFTQYMAEVYNSGRYGDTKSPLIRDIYNEIGYKIKGRGDYNTPKSLENFEDMLRGFVWDTKTERGVRYYASKIDPTRYPEIKLSERLQEVQNTITMAEEFMVAFRKSFNAITKKANSEQENKFSREQIDYKGHSINIIRSDEINDPKKPASLPEDTKKITSLFRDRLNQIKQCIDVLEKNGFGPELKTCNTYIFENKPDLAMFFAQGTSGRGRAKAYGDFINKYGAFYTSTKKSIMVQLDKRSTSPEFASTYFHEFGHHIHDGDIRGDMSNDLENYWKDFYKKNKSQDKMFVSRYSKTNEKEFFAETFAAFMTQELFGTMEKDKYKGSHDLSEPLLMMRNFFRKKYNKAFRENVEVQQNKKTISNYLEQSVDKTSVETNLQNDIRKLAASGSRDVEDIFNKLKEKYKLMPLVKIKQMVSDTIQSL